MWLVVTCHNAIGVHVLATESSIKMQQQLFSPNLSSWKESVHIFDKLLPSWDVNQIYKPYFIETQNIETQPRCQRLHVTVIGPWTFFMEIEIYKKKKLKYVKAEKERRVSSKNQSRNFILISLTSACHRTKHTK